MTDLQFGIILATIVIAALAILAIMWEYEQNRRDGHANLGVGIDKAALEADARERAASARAEETHRTLGEISAAMREHHRKTREEILAVETELHRDSQRALAGALERLATTMTVPARYTVPVPQATAAPAPQKLEWDTTAALEEVKPPASWEEARERGKAERAAPPPEEPTAKVGSVSDFDDILRLAQQKEISS